MTGAVILIEWSGFARSSANGAHELVGRLTHVTDDARYAWLNDRQCAAVAGEGPSEDRGGQFRRRDRGGRARVGATGQADGVGSDRCPSNGPSFRPI